MANVNPKVNDFRMPVHLFTDCFRVFLNLALLFPFFSFDVNFGSWFYCILTRLTFNIIRILSFQIIYNLNIIYNITGKSRYI